MLSRNNDTLYSAALMDLRAEPVVLQVPDVANRYYSFMLVDMVTDNFDYVGTRATGTKAGTYVVTGPGWKGHLPKGAVRISAPTWLVLGVGSDEDRGTRELAAVKAVQAGYRLMPLSKFTGQTTGAVAPKIHFPTFLDTGPRHHGAILPVPELHDAVAGISGSRISAVKEIQSH